MSNRPAAPPQAYTTGAAAPEGAARLHLNEFRGQHAPAVGEALRSAAGALTADRLARYRDEQNDEMVAALKSYLRIGPGPAMVDLGAAAAPVAAPAVAVTAGSDEALRAVVDAAALRGMTAVTGVPGYSHFEHFLALARMPRQEYRVGLATTSADLVALIAYNDKLLDKGALVYIGSPNNPTGGCISAGHLRFLAERYTRSWFLVDEAYAEFKCTADSTGTADGGTADEGTADRAVFELTDLINRIKLPNVIITRTMSKAFGLAALRVGYIVAEEETLREIAVALSPKTLGPLVQPIVLAALNSAAVYLEEAREACAARSRLVAALRARGWRAFEGAGNFFLLGAGAKAQAARLAAALRAQGVYVRDRSELPGMAGFLRITASRNCQDVSRLTDVLDAYMWENHKNSPQTCSAFGCCINPALPTMIQEHYTSGTVIAEIKYLLKEVYFVMCGAGLDPFAQSGTMLGALRHGGIIPTDDDGDLAFCVDAVLTGDARSAGSPAGDARSAGSPAGDARSAKEIQSMLEPLRLKLAGALAPLGITLAWSRGGYYWQAYREKARHVDIFFYFRDAGGRYVLSDPRFAREDPASAEAHCNTSYSPGEIFPLRAAPFYEWEIAVPHAAEAALDRALGADWRRTARVRVAGPAPSRPAAGEAPPGTEIRVEEYELEDFSPA